MKMYVSKFLFFKILVLVLICSCVNEPEPEKSEENISDPLPTIDMKLIQVEGHVTDTLGIGQSHIHVYLESGGRDITDSNGYYSICCSVATSCQSLQRVTADSPTWLSDYTIPEEAFIKCEEEKQEVNFVWYRGW